MSEQTVNADQDDAVDIEDVAAEDESFEWVSVSDLHDDPDNVRTNYTEIEELASSIKNQGVLQPIVVRRDSEGNYVIIMGHRRKRALQHNKTMKTRVIVRHKELLSEDVLAQMLTENGSRVDLDPIDEARGLQKLKVMKALSTDMEVANLVGRTQGWVSGRLRLLELDSDDQQAVRTGRLGISAGVARSRQQGGHVRPGAVGKSSGQVLGGDHALSRQVQRRCESLGHKRGPNIVGGVGCGGCWEVVIRQDERKSLSDKAVANGKCATCGSAVHKEHDETPSS